MRCGDGAPGFSSTRIVAVAGLLAVWSACPAGASSAYAASADGGSLDSAAYLARGCLPSSAISGTAGTLRLDASGRVRAGKSVFENGSTLSTKEKETQMSARTAFGGANDRSCRRTYKGRK